MSERWRPIESARYGALLALEYSLVALSWLLWPIGLVVFMAAAGVYGLVLICHDAIYLPVHNARLRAADTSHD